ncbi:PmoA family protein, partial [bacterium]|nr:PmoA family protein [bacterium]
MPDGLAKQLSPQQVADLIRFIIDAGENPGLLEAREWQDANANGRLHSSTDESAAASKNVLPLTTTDPISFQNNGRSLRIRCGDRDVATYYYKHDEVKRPFFAHVKAPSGIEVTRSFPPGEGDKKDHADMHPGIWMAFGDIGGEDFWRNRGSVVHERFVEPPTGGVGSGSFTQRKSYQRTDGSVVCHEDFRCTIRVVRDGYLIQWYAAFSNPNGDEFYFGDQEEMGLGIRVATPITEVAGGAITDAAGRNGAKRVWSRSSAWCDYSGTVDGKELGMTILCHPDNFRPSWMHARNYGLIAANPFGRKAMRKGTSSKVVVTKGETLRLRYAILVHDRKMDSSEALVEYLQFVGKD